VPNERLRDALATARLTARDVAGKLDVDEKTVARWIADEARTPHPRHRWAVAELVGADEEVLWPEAVRQTIKTGADREIITVYPQRSTMPRSLWRDLIAGATRTLTFAGYTSYFLWADVPNLRPLLRRKVEAGGVVRFLLGDPESVVTAERERIESVPLTVSTRINVTLDQLSKVGAAVDVRLSDRHIALSVWVFDDDMIVCTHLADLLGHDSPTIHLRRRQDGGLYDRYAEHANHLWDLARPHESIKHSPQTR
jgi:transcriptional regulator with XRE-family HTH domain